MRAALDFRNGVLLMIAIALPQRARALSVLEFERTLTLLDEVAIHIHIPGRFIEQREGEKEHHPYDKVIRNAGLSSALSEYASIYRPIFDAGALLFPSFHAPMQGVSERQLGRLAGDLTHEAFDMRFRSIASATTGRPKFRRHCRTAAGWRRRRSATEIAPPRNVTTITLTAFGPPVNTPTTSTPAARHRSSCSSEGEQTLSCHGTSVGDAISESARRPLRAEPV